mmetsp:Transcript_8252/g.15030  ORF Transcript_8252/g.15030 Transcript_8252/m.15030 type:complete len:248 (+) Transcript_8252:65-808(+)
MKNLLLFLFHLSLVHVTVHATDFDCGTDPSSCPDALECDQCEDCYVTCNAPGACEGKTLSCPLDHVCEVFCAWDNSDFPDSTNACANMVINNPTAPRAGDASCLPPGETYAGFRAYCGANGACANVTLNNYCDEQSCNFFACDGWPGSVGDCPDELGGLTCTSGGTGCCSGGGSKTTKSMAPPFDDDAANPGDACSTEWQPYNCTLFQHGDDLDCDFTSAAGYDLGCCGCASLGGCMPDNGQGCDCC